MQLYIYVNSYLFFSFTLSRTHSPTHTPTLTHTDTEEPVRYQATPGVVAFYAEAMPNTADWRRAEQVVTRESSISACHGCSYLCWASQGLDDPEDRCYFNDKHQYPCPYLELSN
jgi:hypothetical protein